jgi:hypothetical protein
MLLMALPLETRELIDFYFQTLLPTQPVRSTKLGLHSAPLQGGLDPSKTNFY